ncbi:MAG: hypothetical protein ABR596_06220 [Halarsenatibacteraceae bacterium]
MGEDSGCLFPLLILALMVSLFYGMTGYYLLLPILYLFGVAAVIVIVVGFFTGD